MSAGPAPCASKAIRVPSREVACSVPVAGGGVGAGVVVMSSRRPRRDIFYTGPNTSSCGAPQEQASLRLVAGPAGRLRERGGRRLPIAAALEEVAAHARDQRRRGERGVAGDRVKDRQAGVG